MSKGPGYQKRAGKYGKVVYIRVRPEDCMTCIDVVHKVGRIGYGMGFAQLVSIALATLCETVRKDGAIPKRTGFEYAEMMMPWDADTRNTKSKVKLNKQLDLAGPEAYTPTVPVGHEVTGEVESRNPMVMRLEAKLAELDTRDKIDPEGIENREEERLQLLAQIAEEYRKEQQ